MTKDVRCDGCPNVADRRELDAAYRATKKKKMEGYDIALPEIKSSIIMLTGVMQKNFNTIYFRMGVISGGAGLISGIVGTLITLHLNK